MITDFDDFESREMENAFETDNRTLHDFSELFFNILNYKEINTFKDPDELEVTLKECAAKLKPSFLSGGYSSLIKYSSKCSSEYDLLHELGLLNFTGGKNVILRSIGINLMNSYLRSYDVQSLPKEETFVYTKREIPKKKSIIETPMPDDLKSLFD